MQCNAHRKTTLAPDINNDGFRISYYHSGKISRSPYSYFLQITLQCLTMWKQSNVSKGTENKTANIIMPFHKSMVGLHLENNTQLSLLYPQEDTASTKGDPTLIGTPQFGERGDQGEGGEWRTRMEGWIQQAENLKSISGSTFSYDTYLNCKFLASGFCGSWVNRRMKPSLDPQRGTSLHPCTV